MGLVIGSDVYPAYYINVSCLLHKSALCVQLDAIFMIQLIKTKI